MTARYLTILALLIGVVAVVAFSAGSCSSETSPPESLASHAQAITGPTTVSGYGECTLPGCTDIARACHDIVATGCGALFAPAFYRTTDGRIVRLDGGVCPARLPADAGVDGGGDGAAECRTGSGSRPICTPDGFDFDYLVTACANAVGQELSEELHELRERSAELLGSPDAGRVLSDRGLFEFYASHMATCTRRAANCAERIDCTRHTFIPPRPPTTNPLPPDWNTPPPAPPDWQKPWKPNAGTVRWGSTPWQSGKLDVIPAVDSPSCVRCAIERCPTFAYRCFGAQGDPVECAGGDCCDSLRMCVNACGGYGDDATEMQFFSCMQLCSQSRPTATQELADLQNCAASACSGCEAFDNEVTGPTLDGGVQP